MVPRAVFRRAAKYGMPVVLPRSLVQDVRRPSGVELQNWTVPACAPCNGAAGAKLDTSLVARIRRVRARRGLDAR